VVCDTQDVLNLDGTTGEILLTESVLVTEADHKYPSFIWSEKFPPVVILYGHLASSKTKTMHMHLKKL